MRISKLATVALTGITFFAGSTPAAPVSNRPVAPNPDSSFTLIHGHGGGGGGGGGFGGGFGGGGFGGFGGGHSFSMGGIGSGHIMGGFGPRVATAHGFGGHNFAARPFAGRGHNFARRARFHHHPTVFRHNHHRHRIFVNGVGWVYSDYCVWPYNWGPWCYD
jgi:hypothetical protein